MINSTRNSFWAGEVPNGHAKAREAIKLHSTRCSIWYIKLHAMFPKENGENGRDHITKEMTNGSSLTQH